MILCKLLPEIDPPPLPPLLFTLYFYISAFNAFSVQNKALSKIQGSEQC